MHVSLAVDITAEPDVRQFQSSKEIHGTATVHDLKSGSVYTIYRYTGTANVPSHAPFATGATATHTFTASSTTYTWADPTTFSSHSATYYVAARGTKY